MNKSKYSVVLLDADETIFDFKLAEKTAFLNTAKEFMISATERDVEIYSEINEKLWKDLEQNQVTREELTVLRFERWFQYIGVRCDAEKFNKHYLMNLSKSGFLISGADEFVRKLSEIADVYIVTNGLSLPQNGRMNNSSIKKYIKKMYISEEIGYAKPDVRYFEYIFDDLKIKDKNNVIIMGDSLSSDMQGGRNAGISTCLFSRNSNSVPNELCDYYVESYDEFIEMLIN